MTILAVTSARSQPVLPLSFPLKINIHPTCRPPFPVAGGSTATEHHFSYGNPSFFTAQTTRQALPSDTTSSDFIFLLTKTLIRPEIAMADDNLPNRDQPTLHGLLYPPAHGDDG